MLSRFPLSMQALVWELRIARLICSCCRKMDINCCSLVLAPFHKPIILGSSYLTLNRWMVIADIDFLSLIWVFSVLIPNMLQNLTGWESTTWRPYVNISRWAFSFSLSWRLIYDFSHGLSRLSFSQISHLADLYWVGKIANGTKVGCGEDDDTWKIRVRHVFQWQPRGRNLGLGMKSLAHDTIWEYLAGFLSC